MTILTLNLNGYGTKHGAWDVRKHLIADAIRHHGPDVLALQAVSRDPMQGAGLDQAAQLATLLPEYRYVRFVPAGEVSGRADGVALVSRLPLDAVTSQRLSYVRADGPPEDSTPRIVLGARVDSVSLFNAHFSWVATQTVANVAETVRYLQRHSGPRLLVGDLNTIPDEPALRSFVDEHWTDLWPWLHPNEPGYTFESQAPSKRIDYAWASPELRGLVKGIEVVTAQSSGPGVRLSDHHGVLVTLS